jgi:hypothetical protein
MLRIQLSWKILTGALAGNVMAQSRGAALGVATFPLGAWVEVDMIAKG